MLEFEELKQKLAESEESIQNLKEALNIDGVKSDIAALEEQSAAPDFWDDMQNSQKVMQKIGSRRGELENMGARQGGATHLEFKIPARGLIGYRSEMINDTHGNGIMVSSLGGYEPYKGEINARTNGVMISNATGTAMTYAIFNLQDHGSFFIGPQTEVYEGMIVGQSSKPMDMEVNPTKNKVATAVRSTGHDEAMRLTPPRVLTLESAIEFISDDELVEITPDSIRIRKKYLTAYERRIHYREGLKVTE